MEGDVVDDPIVALPPDVDDDDILPGRVVVPRKGGGHPFIARPPDISEAEWLHFGSSVKGHRHGARQRTITIRNVCKRSVVPN